MKRSTIFIIVILVFISGCGQILPEPEVDETKTTISPTITPPAATTSAAKRADTAPASKPANGEWLDMECEFDIIRIGDSHGNKCNLYLGMSEVDLNSLQFPESTEFYPAEVSDFSVVDDVTNMTYEFHFNMNEAADRSNMDMALTYVYISAPWETTPSGLKCGDVEEKAIDIYGKPDFIYKMNYTGKKGQDTTYFEYDRNSYYFYIVLASNDKVSGWIISKYSQAPIAKITQSSDKIPEEVTITLQNGNAATFHVGMSEKEFLAVINEKRTNCYIYPITGSSNNGTITRHISKAIFANYGLEYRCIVIFPIDDSHSVDSNEITEFEIKIPS